MSKKTTTKSKYKRVSKGIQQLPSGNYRIRKTTNGYTDSVTVTSMKEAKKIASQFGF